jgi:hypothetical protein
MSEPSSDVAVLQRRVAELEERLGRVEKHVNLEPLIQTPPPVAEPPVIAAPPATPVLTDDLTNTTGGQDASPLPPAVPIDAILDGEQDEQPPTKRGIDFERWFGLYGLSRLGIASLVVGIALLLMHSWENFGPEFKIAFGILSGIGLVVGGEILSRRDRLHWYGLGLVGGGYSAVYFTLYAMQNIASVQIIDNQLLDSCLLLATAGTAMVHSMRKRSEAVALLSTILAFGTISLSQVTMFSVVAAALLVLGIAWVTVRMRWNIVLLVSTVASYLTYMLFSYPQINAGGALLPIDAFWIAFALSAVYWLVYNVTLLFQSNVENQVSKTAALAVAVINAAAFEGLTLLGMTDVMPEWRWLFLTGLGAAYLFGATVFNRRELKTLTTVFTLIGLQALTAAVPLKLDPTAITAVWFIELALLVRVGLQFNLLSFRAFAVPLFALVAARFTLIDMMDERIFNVLGLDVSYRLLVGVFAIGALTFAASSYRLFTDRLTVIEQQLGYKLYFAAAAAVAWALVQVLAPYHLQAVYCGAIGLGLVLLGMYRDRFVQTVAAAFYLTAGITFLSVVDTTSGAVTASVVALFYLATVAWKVLGEQMEPAWRRLGYQVWFIASAALTFVTVGVRVDPQWIPTLLSLEAAIILALGVLTKDNTLRRLAGGAFFLAAGSLLLTEDPWTWLSMLPTIAIGYASSLAYRYLAMEEDKPITPIDSFLAFGSEERGFFQNFYALTSTIFLTIALGALLNWQWLAAAWAIEGIVLLAIGLSMWDRLYRLAGLVVFGLLIGKLLFFDLSGADTVGRIVSFMVAGVVLLAASYVYNRFVKKLEEANKQEETKQ